MISPQEQMEIIKAAISSGYQGPIYKLIEQAIIERSSSSQQQPQTPQVGTPALGGKIPGDPPTTSTERNIIQPGQYETGGVRKFHEGGAADQEHMDMMNMGTLDAHNAEGDTGGDTGGGMYGADAGTPGENMEWGAGFNMGGPGFGFKTPYGSYNMLPQKPKNWGDAAGLLMGPAANLTGLAGKAGKAGKNVWNKVKSWFEDGGVRKYSSGGLDLSLTSRRSINCGPGSGRGCGRTESPLSLQTDVGLNYNTGTKVFGAGAGLGLQGYFGGYDTREGAPIIAAGLRGGGSLQGGNFKGMQNNEEGANPTFTGDLDLYGKLGFKKKNLQGAHDWSSGKAGFEAGVYGNYDLLNKNIKDVGIYGGYGVLGGNIGYDFNDKMVKAGIGLNFKEGGFKYEDGGAHENEDEKNKLTEKKSDFSTTGWDPDDLPEGASVYGGILPEVVVGGGEEGKKSAGFQNYMNLSTPYYNRLSNTQKTFLKDSYMKGKFDPRNPYSSGSIPRSIYMQAEQGYGLDDNPTFTESVSDVVEPILYTAVGAAGLASPLGGMIARPLWGAANTNLLPTIAGTSAMDALGAYGLYHGATELPGDVVDMSKDPSWGKAGEIGMDVLGVAGGVFTGSRLLSNFSKADKADDIVRLNQVSNRITSNNSTLNSSTNKNIISSNLNAGAKVKDGAALDKVVENYTPLVNQNLDEAYNFSLVNFNADANLGRITSLEGRASENILKTYNQQSKFGNAPYSLRGRMKSDGTISKAYGQSGEFGTTRIGDRVSAIDDANPIYRTKDWTDDVIKHHVAPGEPIPRYSQVNTENIIRDPFTKRLNTPEKIAQQTKSTGTHEWDHTIKMSEWDATRRGYGENNFSLNIFGGRNQLGTITREGVIDASTIGVKGKTPEFFGKFNTNTGTFDKIPMKTNKIDDFFGTNIFNSNKKLNILKDMKNAPNKDFGDHLTYMGQEHEMGAKIAGFRGKHNIGIDKYNVITKNQGKDFYKLMENTDPNFWATFKDAESFTKMMNKYPYAIVPPAIGLGLGSGEANPNATSMPNTQKKGGYRSISPARMLYNNRKGKK